MVTSAKRVEDWIDENFNVEMFEVIDFPLFPGGKILRDAEGAELLVYHDILSDEVIIDIQKKNR